MAAGGPGAALVPLLATHSLRAAARLASRFVDLRAHGLEHIPSHGSVVLAVRHFHHLWDGVALLALVPRRVQLLVALDWVEGALPRRVMEWATRTAGWPVVLRPEGLADGLRSAYRRDELDRYRLRALRDSVAVLCAGGVLAVFPEGFPTVDPRFTPKRHTCTVLPFRTGFIRAAQIAARRTGRAVPIVAVGLHYVRRNGRWTITLRCGPPRLHAGDPAAVARAVRAEVCALSGLRP